MAYQTLFPLDFKTKAIAAAVLSTPGMFVGGAVFSKTGSALEGIIAGLVAEMSVVVPILVAYVLVHPRIGRYLGYERAQTQEENK